jgi:hypothetical protein
MGAAKSDLALRRGVDGSPAGVRSLTWLRAAISEIISGRSTSAFMISTAVRIAGGV